MASYVVIDRRLYVTADGSRVVEAGDPAAATLWAAPGQRKPRAEAERLGAVAQPSPAAEVKQRPPAANKQRRTGRTKTRGGGPNTAEQADTAAAGEQPRSREW